MNGTVNDGRRRSWWGWGWQDAQVGPAERAEIVARLPPHWVADPLPVPTVAELALPVPRVRPPASLAALCTNDVEIRAGHTYGKAYRDVIRALRGEFANAPDLVAFPVSDAQVVDLLDWASTANVAVIPYGGGSSVVGGVEYRGGDHGGVLSLDLGRLDRVLDVDRVSCSAHIQAGVLGPNLERQLGEYGYTLRHFPQSFEFSTLGGWIATRAAGHYTMGRTHIDDFVQALNVISPTGTTRTSVLPASGAGPSPDRLFIGSEGTLGVITEAWLRLRKRPRYKASRGVTFDEFDTGMSAVRAIAQSGLEPSNCRLLDPAEAAVNTGRTDGAAVLVLGFESADHPVDANLARAMEIAADQGGFPEPPSTQDSVGAWRSAFLRMPYTRDCLARSGVVVETFETACLWRDAAELCACIRTGVSAATTEICGEPGLVTVRLTHVYPDGVAPYFTVIARAERGREVAIWDEIKVEASAILARFGASITHHHAIGRDHRRWYDAQRPDSYSNVLRAAKNSLDPRRILNPGVLFD